MQELTLLLTATLRRMWKFRWAGVVIAWAVAAVGVVAVWRIPDQFEAAARIYVDTDSILKPLMSGLAVQPNVEQQVAMLSRTLISRPNIEKLVRMADLDLKSSSKQDQDALIDKLTRGIEVRTSSGANLYSMAYRDSEPDRAKRVIQSMVSIFVESGLGASRKDTDAAKTFLSEQIKSYEAKLEEAEARVKAFRLRNIERQNADGKDAAGRISEMYTLLEAAKLQLREAEKSRDAAKRQLAEARGANAGVLAGRDPVTSIVVTTPETDGRIEAQKRNLDGLLQRYTEQHPDVLTTRRLIADLEEQRRKEVLDLQRKAASQRSAPGVQGSPSDSLAVQELNRMLATAEVQVAALQARASEYTSRYTQARQDLKTAPQIEAEAAQLNRDYAITKRNYEDLVSRRQSAVMSGELDVASGVAEFRLIDPPRVTPKPVSPNRTLLMLLVLGAALAAGVVSAFAASQLRPTFGSAEELRLKVGLPLLGVVSMLVTDTDRRRDRMSLYRFVAASGGLVGVFMAGLIAMTTLARYGSQ